MDDFIEAVVVVTREEQRSFCMQWFDDRFSTVPMRAGFLLTGSAADFADLFGVQIGDRTEPIELPIPEPLRDNVERIFVRANPEYHKE